ncbi:hypothetical protein STEG23_004206 [Scotinomys teguina]
MIGPQAWVQVGGRVPRRVSVPSVFTAVRKVTRHLLVIITSTGPLQTISSLRFNSVITYFRSSGPHSSTFTYSAISLAPPPILTKPLLTLILYLVPDAPQLLKRKSVLTAKQVIPHHLLNVHLEYAPHKSLYSAKIQRHLMGPLVSVRKRHLFFVLQTKAPVGQLHPSGSVYNAA